MNAPGGSRARIVAVFGALVAIWGTTWLAIRIGLESYPPFFSLALRFCVAGPLILLILRLRGERIPWDLRHQPFFLLLGLLSYVTSFGVVYWGEQYVTSGLAAVIFGLLPLLTGVVAHFLLPSERLGPGKVLGLALGLGGIVVLNSANLSLIHPRAPLAAIVLTVSPLVTAISSVLSKKRVHEFPALALAGIPMIYAGLLHIVLWRVFEHDRPIAWSWPGVASIAYLTVFGSVVTFTGYFWLLRRLEVSRVSLIAYMTPLVALTVGVVFGGETLPGRVIAGAALVLCGVGVASRVRRRL